MELEVLQANVDRGARYMDKYMPGWHRRINVWRLDISSCTGCVLGQTFGDYFGVEAQRFLKTLWRPLNFIFSRHFIRASRYGFYERSMAGCMALTAMWREAIAVRLVKDAKKNESAQKQQEPVCV